MLADLQSRLLGLAGIEEVVDDLAVDLKHAELHLEDDRLFRLLFDALEDLFTELGDDSWGTDCVTLNTPV